MTVCTLYVTNGSADPGPTSWGKAVVSMNLRRALRWARRWLAQRMRLPVLLALGLLGVLSMFLLWLARDAEHFADSLELNLGADLIGSIVVIFMISPLITRAQYGRVREHRRLDYEWFTDQVARASSQVRILDTFSQLLEGNRAAQFFPALLGALRRQARARILLLDPDSLAAIQRANELSAEAGGADAGHADVRREIMRNLRALDAFQRGLPPWLRTRLEIRVYSASASVTLYRWDDRALVSCLPIGRLSGDGTQLEISVTSPLGTFVGERFDELWRHGRPLTAAMETTFTVTDGAGATRQYTARFICIDEHYYLAEPQLLAQLALTRDGSLQARLAAEPTRLYLVDAVDGDSELQAALVDHYDQKYEQPADAFVRLVPVDEVSREPLVASE
jgi:hypothetical protein